MPLKRDNDEERVARINERTRRIDMRSQKSANRLRAPRWDMYRDGDGTERTQSASLSRVMPWLPDGYRLVDGKPTVSVVCDRGCGWTLPLETLMALSAAARLQLFQFHEDAHEIRQK